MATPSLVETTRKGLLAEVSAEVLEEENAEETPPARSDQNRLGLLLCEAFDHLGK